MTLLRQQLLVHAVLDDLSVAKNDDLVRAGNGAQAVSDDSGRFAYQADVYIGFPRLLLR